MRGDPPAKQPADPAAAETVETRFRRLEATWLAEVGYSSSSTELRSHPAFQEIIRLGDAVVPLMLRDHGRWTSKLGPMEDNEHALHDLSGMVYGSVVLVMKRPLPVPHQPTIQGG